MKFIFSKFLIFIFFIFSLKTCNPTIQKSLVPEFNFFVYFTNPPLSVVYSNSSIILTVNERVAPIFPIVSGRVSKCSSTPTLPIGLLLSDSDCSISGTPISIQPPTNYTIVSKNNRDTVTNTISISIDSGTPLSLTYNNSPFVFSRDIALTPILPTYTGTITNCIASPTLPTGLILSSSTCSISGTPSIDQPFTTYSITASNSNGSVATSISITINNNPPASLVFTGNPFVFTINSNIVPIVPSVSGTISSCSSSPTLPTGLVLSNNCTISGNPSVEVTASNFTITGSNLYGTTNTSITITVNNIPPTSLAYGVTNVVLTKDIAMASLTPTVIGTVTNYSVSPALPTGITINNSTGEITGTPTILSSITIYTITASNSAGSTQTIFSITVNDAPPSSLSYLGNPFTFVDGSLITPVDPTVTGSVTSYNVSPSLPTGLTINASSGQLAGTPTLVSPSTNYTITATNSIGSTQTIISIVVLSSTFTISGTVTGSTSSGFEISYGGVPTLIVPGGSTSYTFTNVPANTAYSMSVLVQPASPYQTCTFTNGTGTITSNVTNANISCTTNQYRLTVTISGYDGGSGLVLNDGITSSGVLTSGTTTFSFPLANSGLSYNFSTTTLPTAPSYDCTAPATSGTFANADIAVTLTCTIVQKAVTGTITGLGAGESITITVASGVTVPITGTGTPEIYTSPLISSGTGFSVSTTSPVNKVCVTIPLNITGTIIDSNITAMDINCVTGTQTDGQILTIPQQPLHIHLNRGNVSTFTGLAAPGTADGSPADAQFNSPSDICFNGTNFFVTDTQNHTIRKVTPSGTVSTLAGDPGNAGFSDGLGSGAKFNTPRGITTDGTFLYVSENLGKRIRRVRISDGNVETLAGDTTVSLPTTADTNGIGTAARFGDLSGLLVKGNILYIADTGNSKIKILNLSTKAVTTLSSSAQLNSPIGLSLFNTDLYVTTSGHLVARVDTGSGSTNALAGDQTPGYRESYVNGTYARVNTPVGIINDGTDVYITENGNHKIRSIKISNGKVRSLVGGSSGSANGFGVNASFTSMGNMTTDGRRIYFISENRIRTLTNHSLVAYHTLANMNDYSGMNNDLTATGSPILTTGRKNEANGATEFVAASYLSSTTSPSSSTSGITMAIWAKWSGTNIGDEQILMSNGSTSNGYLLTLRSASSNRLVVLENNVSWGTCEYTLSTTWTHIAAVLTNSSIWKMYINGNFFCEFPSGGAITPSGNYSIGGRPNVANQSFLGSLADARFYNRVLNESEINELAANAESFLVGNAINQNASDMLFHFDFENSSLTDKATYGTSLTGTNTFGFGKDGDINGGTNFNGTTNSLSITPTVGLPTGDSPRSICAWIKPALRSGNHTIAAYGTNSAGSMFGISLLSNKYSVWTSGGSNLASTQDARLNTWQHFCGTYDPIGGARIYVDGVMLGTIAASSFVTVNTSSSTVMIGRNTLDATDSFSGMIDDVRIFNTALTGATIRRLAVQVPKGLLVYYDFSGDALDISGNGRNGAIVGSVTQTTDRNGITNSSYNFTGTTGNYISGSGVNLPSGVQPRTMCMWYRATSGDYAIPFIMGDPSLANSPYSIWLQTQNLVRAWGQGSDINANIEVPNYQWRHVCIQYGSGTGNVFVDGRLVASGAQTLNTGAVANFFVGSTSISGREFGGAIDDPRIYNRVLTQNEIRALSGHHVSQATSWNPSGGSSSLKLHLRADSLSNLANSSNVTSWNDMSGNANHVTSAMFPTFVTSGIGGKSSINFNSATSQYLERVTSTGVTGNNFVMIAVHSPTLTGTIIAPFSIGSTCGNDKMITINAGNRFDMGICGVFVTSATSPLALTDSLYIQSFKMVPLTTSELRINNEILISNTNSFSTYIGDSHIGIGFRANGANRYYNGKISEILYFDSNLSENDMIQTHCYLSARYGIEIGNVCN
jgi:hypothetical protein